MSNNFNSVEFIESQIGEMKRFLEGRILTIVDASVSDREQRKAIKDLVRESIWSEEGYTKSILNVVEGKPPYKENLEPVPVMNRG